MFRIVAVGKIKEKYLTDAIKEYVKRITKYTNFQITEVKEVNTPDVNKNIKLEGENILAKVNPDEFVIALAINGEVFDSENMARYLREKALYGDSKITFIIGGSNGLSEAVLKRANIKLSFSAFTFPHQLMRLILIEQIYRSLMINNNKEYHK